MPSKYGPKKPLAPYFIFMGETRQTVKAENPDASSTDLCALLGQKWRSLPPDARANYEKRAEDDRARYQKEHERWVIEHPDEVALADAAKRKPDPQQPPKRFLSPYIFFAQAVRAETKKEAPDAKVS